MSDITPAMATILGEMRANRAPRTRDEILQALDGAVTHTPFVRAVRAMISDGLIDVVRASTPNKRIAGLLAINDAGLVKLRAFKRRMAEAERRADKARVVPPRRINLFALPTLQCSPSGYRRNDGNRHIASQGTRC